MTQDSFLLWIDCFSTHEPWSVTPEPGELLFPAYGSRGLFTESQSATLRSDYAKRIAAVDEAMKEFSENVVIAASSGDIGIVVLSDHGFLFGEYQLVGKPKDVPVLPPLHDLVFWLSPNLREFAPSSVDQPHLLTRLLAQALDVDSVPASWNFKTGGSQVLGRNSPETTSLVVTFESGMAILFRDDLDRAAEWIPWSDIDPERPWDHSVQPLCEIGTHRNELFCSLLSAEPWGRRFLGSLTRSI